MVDAGTFILNDSRLTAQAEWGAGGNLDVRAKLFIKSADSVVSASSRYGAQGTVVIDAPTVDVDAALAAPFSASSLLDAFLPKRCATEGEVNASSFRVVGEVGLPPGPESNFPTGCVGAGPFRSEPVADQQKWRPEVGVLVFCLDGQLGPA